MLRLKWKEIKPKDSRSYFKATVMGIPEGIFFCNSANIYITKEKEKYLCSVGAVSSDYKGEFSETLKEAKESVNKVLSRFILIEESKAFKELEKRKKRYLKLNEQTNKWINDHA